MKPCKHCKQQRIDHNIHQYCPAMNTWGDILGWQQTRYEPALEKKSGWINIYPAMHPRFIAGVSNAFATKEAAYEAAKTSEHRVACIKIEWEE